MVPMLIGMSDRGPDSAGMAVFTPRLLQFRLIGGSDLIFVVCIAMRHLLA